MQGFGFVVVVVQLLCYAAQGLGFGVLGSGFRVEDPARTDWRLPKGAQREREREVDR